MPGRAHLRSLLLLAAACTVAYLATAGVWQHRPAWSAGPAAPVPGEDTVTDTADLHRLCLTYNLLDTLDPSTAPPTLHALLDIDVEAPPFADGGLDAPLNSRRGREAQDAILRHLHAALTAPSAARNPDYDDVLILAAQALVSPSARALYLERFAPIVTDGGAGGSAAGWRWRRQETRADVRKRRVQELKRLCGGLWRGQDEA